MADGPEPSELLPLRPAADADADELAALIARCWADYPGSYFDRHGEMAGLDSAASDYAARGGRLWVVPWAAAAAGHNAARFGRPPTGSPVARHMRIVGSVGAAPAADGAWETTKVYVDPRLRRAGLGRMLMDKAEAAAAAAGARRMLLWTDTRFETAHRFYERLGYVADGRTRALDDLSRSVEYFYAKSLGGPPDGAAL